MSRRPFGGTPADVVTDTRGNTQAGVVLQVWTDQVGGTHLTDLQTPAGAGVTAVTSGTVGEVAFLGPPDGTSSVWLGPSGGQRFLFLATDIPARVTTLESGGGSGAVASVNGHVGVVVLAAADVGADASGAAAAAQAAAISAAATDATSKVGTETTRATTAEALKAPLASPTFTGTPAAPTAAPGTNTTQVATTAFTAAAVAVEAAARAAGDATSAPVPGAGDAGKVVTVNEAEDGYELSTPSAGGGGSALFRLDTTIYSYSTNFGYADNETLLLPDAAGFHFTTVSPPLTCTGGESTGVACSFHTPTFSAGTLTVDGMDFTVCSTDGTEKICLRKSTPTVFTSNHNVDLDFTDWDIVEQIGTGLSVSGGSVDPASALQLTGTLVMTITSAGLTNPS